MLAGRGSEENIIRSYVSQKQLDEKVVFLGVRRDIPDLMNMFDVFLFPSYYEGLGIVGIEAQAAGLPCFFSENIPEEAAVTEHVWTQHLENGAERWANEILKIVESFQRKDSTNKIIDAGYDIKNIAIDLQRFYLKRAGEK